MADFKNETGYPDGDSYMYFDEESMVPFKQQSDGADPNPNARWNTGDADFAATAMDCKVHSDGHVTTRAKTGPGGQAGSDMDGGTP